MLFSSKQIGRISATVKEVHWTSFPLLACRTQKDHESVAPLGWCYLLLRPFSPIFIRRKDREVSCAVQKML